MPTSSVGDRVSIFMPAAKSSKAHKLARPFHGPFRIQKLHDNGVEIRPVDKSRDSPIRVSFDRLRVCPDEVSNEFWPKAHVALVFDEVKVKEGIVYDKHWCHVLGFLDMGDINNQLL